MSPWSVRSNSTIEGRLRHWRPDQSLVVRADPFRSSDGGNYLVEVEARQSWAERRVGGMADVHHEQRLVTAVRKKFSGDPIGIEPAHRTRHQARGADADQEIADLERGVEHCRSLTALLIGEAIPGAGIDGEDLRQLLVEVKIRGAEAVLALLPSETWPRRRARASGVRIRTIRSGWLFIEVGAHLMRS